MLRAQSGAHSPSMASAPGSLKRLQKRGARTSDSEAKVHCDAAQAGVRRSARDEEPQLIRPRMDSTFTSCPKSAPPRDAPSIPSATRVRPGTWCGRQSTSTAAAARSSRSAQRCIGGD
jgi:hypothetical protein